MSVAPIGRSTVVDRLTDALIDAVIAGEFQTGVSLPPERELAVAFDVNRTTLRQAVARLEQIGLVQRRQGSGTVAQDPRVSSSPAVVARLARAEARAFVADLIEVREALATVIGRRARAGIDAARRDELGTLVRRIEVAERADERQVLELAFFGVLVDAAGNRAITALMRWVEQVYDNLGVHERAGNEPSIAAAFDDSHVLVARLDALLEVIDGDGDLAAAMTRYAQDTGQRLLDAIAT